MKYFKLQDMNVSAIALGCMRIGSKSYEDVEKLVLCALDNGINFFDHADLYGGGKSEEIFGEVLAKHPELREKMIIQSKCCIRRGFYDCSKEYIIESVKGSLSRLKTDYLDILLIHRPDALMDVLEVAQAFKYLYDEGLVKHFGVSNMNSLQIELLQKACGQKLIANQLELSLAHTCLIDAGLNVNMKSDLSIDRCDDVLNYCRINDIMVQAWSILQIDLFQGSFLNNPNYEELNKRINVLADKYSVTPAAIAVAWILRHPAHIQAIAGTTSTKHLEELCAAAEVELERKEWYDLYLFDKKLA